jgi:hypothetical protein
MIELPYFSLENVDAWLQDGAYRAFRYFRANSRSGPSKSLHNRPLAPHTPYAAPITPPSSSAIVKVESLTEDRELLRKALLAVQPTSSLEPIEISSDEEPAAIGIKRKQPIRGNARVSEASIDVSSDSDGPPPVAALSSIAARPSKKAKMSKQQDTSHSTAPLHDATKSIRITTKEVVANIVHFETVPTIWEVPQVPTAYVVDLSNDTELPRTNDGNLRTLTWFIRQEVSLFKIQMCLQLIICRFRIKILGAAPLEQKEVMLKFWDFSVNRAFSLEELISFAMGQKFANFSMIAFLATINDTNMIVQSLIYGSRDWT